MKHKISSVIIFLSVAFIGVAYGGNDVNDDVRASVHEFIDSLYKCAKGDIACDAEEFSLGKRAKDNILHMFLRDFIEKKKIMEEPLTVEVIVKEWYRPERFPPPFHEVLFILEDVGNFNWKVVEITEPGL